jgi:hypothetical protein
VMWSQAAKRPSGQAAKRPSGQAAKRPTPFLALNSGALAPGGVWLPEPQRDLVAARARDSCMRTYRHLGGMPHLPIARQSGAPLAAEIWGRSRVRK